MSITLSHTANNRSKAKSVGPKSIKLFRKKRIKDKQKARLYADLHLLLSSGLDINTTFEILIGQTDSDWEKKQYQGVRDSIIAGSPLADAMKKWKLADQYEYYSLKIGEESGKVEEVLSEIKRYFERKIMQRRQVTGALTYPVMVLLTAVVAVGFMLNVIVPMFEEVFKRFQGELPGLTQKIIDLSDWMKQYMLLVILIIACFVFAFRQLWKKDWFRLFWHRLALRIPLSGKLVKDLQTARFCHIMALLTAAKSPLVQSLYMVADMIGFLPLKASVSQIADDISKGVSFHDSVSKSGFFDRKFVSLIKAGEEVNKLEYAFSQLNDQYNQETDHKLSVLSSLLEPMLIVIVGGLVAVILIAMYLPLFQIGSSIY